MSAITTASQLNYDLAVCAGCASRDTEPGLEHPVVIRSGRTVSTVHPLLGDTTFTIPCYFCGTADGELRHMVAIVSRAAAKRLAAEVTA